MTDHLTRHDWQYSGGYETNGTRYTKWACPCGAFKIVERDVVADESGTHEVEE